MRLTAIPFAVCLLVIPALAESANTPSAALDFARKLNQAFIELADRVSPSVVVITVEQKPNSNSLDDEENPFWDLLPREFRRELERQREKQRSERENSPGRKEPPSIGQGSGVVIREEGYILTNRHVVDGAEKIKVRFKDGEEYVAEVRGVDAQSDLAVLKIDTRDKKLPAAQLADSDKTRVGEFAIAIGAPFYLDYSVTFGHVSAKGRSHVIQDMMMDQDFIQTDASINPGNSGGPLVNIEGEVIGINTLIRGLRTGIGFAIPSNLAREVADKLIADGKYVRAWLGVRIESLRDSTEYRDLVNGVTEGVVIKEIIPKGPAANSELKASDIVTAVDGKPVASGQQLKNAIRSRKIGEEVTLDVNRAGKNIKVKVRPDSWPEDAAVLVSGRRDPEGEPVETASSLGLKVQALTSELAEQYDLEKSEGVIVTEVERGSIAHSKGIAAGDIITEINRKPVDSIKQFREALKGADLKKGVIVNFTSRGTSKFEILKESGD